MSASDRAKFTRAGLLGIAGSRRVTAYSTPYENDFREVAPVEMPLADYATFLDQRVQDPVSNLSYVFERLPEDEGPLGVAREVPKLLRSRVDLRSAQFTLGGALMGSPLHHHVDAATRPCHARCMHRTLGQLSLSPGRRIHCSSGRSFGS